MNDPHVVSVRYKLKSEGISYADPPSRRWETDAFRLRLHKECAILRMKEHHATERGARDCVDPYLRTWMIHSDLSFGRGALRFEFLSSRIIDRNPPKPGEGKVVALEAAEIAAFADSVTPHVTRKQYPDPPSSFSRTPEVEMLWPQYEAFLDDRVPLSHVANFCLTVLEDPFEGEKGGKRRAAAGHWRVQFEVLKTLGELAATKGGKWARKRAGVAQDFTPSEMRWLKQAIKKLVLRAGEDLSAQPDEITMADLPSLQP